MSYALTEFLPVRAAGVGYFSAKASAYVAALRFQPDSSKSRKASVSYLSCFVIAS